MPTRSTALAAALEPLRDLVVGLDDVTGPVVVGCSGGADSLTLLAVACERGLDPIAVHVDHGLRASSAEEGERVAAAAITLGARAESRRVEIGTGPNLEARAREARYEALTDAADTHGASHLLVGHTADDQAETVLLALLRGSGSAGLAGMPVRRGRLVRPLLRVRRAETEACCVALGLEPVRDPMNDDRAYRRAWIRHEVLPLLESGAARDLVPVLARQADVLRDESDYLDALARAAWPPDPQHAPGACAGAAAAAAGSPGRAVLARCAAALARRGGASAAVARGEARATELAGWATSSTRRSHGARCSFERQSDG